MNYDKWKTRSPDDDRPDGEPDDSETIEFADIIKGAAVSLIEIADDDAKLQAAMTTHAVILGRIMHEIEELEFALDPTLRDH